MTKKLSWNQFSTEFYYWRSLWRNLLIGEIA